jgi:hypothetical protein
MDQFLETRFIQHGSRSTGPWVVSQPVEPAVKEPPTPLPDRV